MYPDYPSYRNYARPYTGQSPYIDRCPVCGSLDGDCPDPAPVPMPLPAFDLGEVESDRGGPLRLYAVTVFGFTTHMQLTDADAARYGDAAALVVF